MTTEEKLQHFRETCMADARNKAAKMLDEYQMGLEKTFEEHKADETRRADMQVKAEGEKIARSANKDFALEQIKLRMEYGKRADELKEMLFVELKDKLAAFMESPDYEKMLDAQISEAMAFAGDDEIVIYMDPADEKLIQSLSFKHGIPIATSKYAFSGGMRAVIPHKNILIDNSFEKKLETAKESFDFEHIEGGADE